MLIITFKTGKTDYRSGSHKGKICDAKVYYNNTRTTSTLILLKQIAAKDRDSKHVEGGNELYSVEMTCAVQKTCAEKAVPRRLSRSKARVV